MSIRTQQVESTLQRVISQVLQREVSDPRIRGLVSVTRVQVSPDLHDAQVYISVLPDKYATRTLAGLQSAVRHIQTLVRNSMAMKMVPRLEFRLDETLKRQAQVFDAIREGMEQSGPAPPPPPEEGEQRSPDAAPEATSKPQRQVSQGQQPPDDLPQEGSSQEPRQ